MSVLPWIWQARAGLDTQLHGPLADETQRRALCRRWGVADDPDAAYAAICEALDGRLGRLSGWVRGLEGILTGAMPSVEATPEDMLDDWLSHGIVIRRDGMLHVVWEAWAAVTPRLDFTPPLLACLLGRHDIGALAARAMLLGITDAGDRYPLRARIYRALAADDARAGAGAEPHGAGILFGLIDRAGAPVPRPAQADAETRARLFGYPDPDAEVVCLPLEIADALAPRRLAVLDAVMAETRAGLPSAPAAAAPPTDARIAPLRIAPLRIAPLRAAALRLACAEAPPGPPGWDAPGTHALARATLQASGDPPLIDRGPEAITDHHLRQLLGPLDATRETLTALIGVDQLVATLAGGRGLMASANAQQAVVDAIGRDLQRLLSRAQWAALDTFGGLPTGPVALDELAELIALASARGVAASHRDRWALAARLPPELVPLSAGELLASTRRAAARRHVIALVERALAPLGLTAMADDAVTVDGPALAAALRRVRDGITPTDDMQPATFTLGGDGGLQINAPATTRLASLIGLARTGRLRWHGTAWQATLDPSQARDPGLAALLGDLGAGASAIGPWLRAHHGPPRITRLNGFTPVEAESEGEMDVFLAGLPAAVARRIGPRVALVRTASLDGGSGADGIGADGIRAKSSEAS